MVQHLTRRSFLAAGTGALAAGRLWAAPLEAAELGLEGDSGADQSATLQNALDTAHAGSRDLLLPAGNFTISDIVLPPGTGLFGTAGRTVLQLGDGDAILTARDAPGIALNGLHLRGKAGERRGVWTGLLSLQGCTDIMIDNCRFSASAANGVFLDGCAGRITRCTLHDILGAAIASHDGAGLHISANSISDGGNLGIYVARSEPGHDGAIITGNRISRIDWKDGGNGQNGNGINIFRAGDVVVSGNVISDCTFSAVRLNTTRNCLISNNICTRSSEVAIFSEFGFSGSIISDNIIDGAAQGISITNFDDGGRLAICSGNIVRNIRPESPTNPDTTPVGIAAEADTILTGNLVENVPGVGLALGWGPYLRDVNATGNLLRDCAIGIGVSVADEAGAASVTNNVIHRPPDAAAIAAMLWDEIAEADLPANATRYPQVMLAGNQIIG